MLLELLSACSAFRAAPGTARAVVPLRAPLPLMASWTAADMKSKRLKLPEEVDELLSPDTSRKEVEILWGALRSCYGTESEAVAAAARNTGTILPYLNSPSNIKGCYAVLVEIMGSEQAGEVCAKNPGILQCNPRVLALEQPDSLLRAAETVDFFEGALGSLPPTLRQNLDKVAFSLLLLPVAKRLADCSGQTCGL